MFRNLTYILLKWIAVDITSLKPTFGSLSIQNKLEFTEQIKDEKLQGNEMIVSFVVYLLQNLDKAVLVYFIF